MKLRYIIIGIILVFVLFGAGFLTGKYTQRKETVTVTSVDTTIVTEFIHDTTVKHETVVLSKTDTFYIDSTTPIGEIPVRTAEHDSIIPYLVGDVNGIIPYHMEIDYRGILYGYRLTTKPYPYELKLNKPSPKFFDKSFGICGSIEIDQDYSVGIDSRIVFLERLELTPKFEYVKDDTNRYFKSKLEARVRI